MSTGIVGSRAVDLQRSELTETYQTDTRDGSKISLTEALITFIEEDTVTTGILYSVWRSS